MLFKESRMAHDHLTANTWVSPLLFLSGSVDENSWKCSYCGMIVLWMMMMMILLSSGSSEWRKGFYLLPKQSLNLRTTVVFSSGQSSLWKPRPLLQHLSLWSSMCRLHRSPSVCLILWMRIWPLRRWTPSLTLWPCSAALLKVWFNQTAPCQLTEPNPPFRHHCTRLHIWAKRPPPPRPLPPSSRLRPSAVRQLKAWVFYLRLRDIQSHLLNVPPWPRAVRWVCHQCLLFQSHAHLRHHHLFTPHRRFWVSRRWSPCRRVSLKPAITAVGVVWVLWMLCHGHTRSRPCHLLHTWTLKPFSRFTWPPHLKPKTPRHRLKPNPPNISLASSRPCRPPSQNHLITPAHPSSNSHPLHPPPPDRPRYPACTSTRLRVQGFTLGFQQVFIVLLWDRRQHLRATTSPTSPPRPHPSLNNLWSVCLQRQGRSITVRDTDKQAVLIKGSRPSHRFPRRQQQLSSHRFDMNMV